MDSGQLGVVVGNEAVDRSGFRDPLFLLAPARSYSTVSIALLAGHPELYGLPETSLFLRETVGEIMAMPAGQFTEQDVQISNEAEAQRY